MKILLLNGPPRAGKDTAAKAIMFGLCNTMSADKIPPYIIIHEKLSRPLKHGAHVLFGRDVPAEFYEDVKDLPHEDFLGKTPRETYIGLSEGFIKPYFGEEAFGLMFVRRLLRQRHLVHVATGGEALCVCSDLGFREEMRPLIKEFGAENILILHIVRDGCSFVGDSRSYIAHKDVCMMTVANNGTVEEFKAAVVEAALTWLKKYHADKTTAA